MQNPSTQVGTSAGQVRGVESDGMLIWRGVPFAAPPVGALRHRPPVPPPSWAGVRTTVEVPAIAWQSPPPAGMPAPLGTPPPPPTDEDCLYLSVTRPDGPLPTGGLPVLVWIHGGGYITGSSALDTDGVALARQGLLVVSLNMAGSVPDAADLVVTDPVQAGVMTVMAIADTAKFRVDRLKRRVF